MDSCGYDEEGRLVFCRVYNLFKENDYEDKRYTWNSAGLLTKSVSYDMNGSPWLTDSVGFDTENRRISEKVYRNTNGQVFMDKKMRYQGNRVDIEDTNSSHVFLRTYDSAGRPATETLYKDTTVIERTIYTYAGKLKVKRNSEGRYCIRLVQKMDHSGKRLLIRMGLWWVKYR